jgi:UDP-glucose 4-epimerase
MVVLVTGGSGLVGARLLPRLVAQGLECRALLRPGRPAPAGVEVIEGDLLEPAGLCAALRGVDAVVHLAAQFRGLDDQATWRVNHEGTRHLIEAVRVAAPAARFVMASTIMIYDAEAARPGREDDLASPTMAYPASKLAAENDLRASGLNWSILRLSFVYGEKDGHLESLAPLLQRFGLHPAGSFSLVHHRDVAAAFGLALQGVMDGRIVNIVDEAPTTAYEMVQVGGGEVEPSSQPLVNPWRGRADGSLARGLGFQPSVRTLHQAQQEGLL